MIKELEAQQQHAQYMIDNIDNVQDARNSHRDAIAETKLKKEAFDKLPCQTPAGTTGGTFAVTLKENKTKKSDDEWHIPIPLSNEAIVIHHKNFKEAVTKSVFGYGEMTIGVLGFIDQFEATSQLLGPQISVLARTIGFPARVGLYTISSGASWLLEPSSNAYAIGNLTLFGAGAYLGVYCIKKTNFTWFHWKPKAGEKWFDGGQCIKDCGWTFAGLLSFGTAMAIGEKALFTTKPD
jgi:hypothetical protein